MTEELDEKGLPTGRIGRFLRMGKLAAGLASDVAGAAGRLALGGDRDEVALRLHRAAAEQLAAQLGRMKGLPMKVGQMISYIDDFIPADYRAIYGDALRRLQTRASPLRWEEVEAVIRGDLGAAPDAIFARFDRTPIAAASIGQVYRAALKDGREVAVKIQYPGIAEAIRSDLKNIDVLKSALGMVLPKVDVERSLADITSRVVEECDYGCELNNQLDFARIWKDDPDVLVPKVFPEVSGDRVLVSEFLPGRSFADMLKGADGAERNRLARILYRFVFRSLHTFGLFNADPHPGNYLFMPDGRIAFLDYGCVQRFDEATIHGFKSVRRMVVEGVRTGAAFRDAMIESYGVPRDLDEEQWAFLEEYILLVLEPSAADRDFKIDRAFTEKILDISVRGGVLGARKAVKSGIWEAKKPGLVFLNRLQYGFASILCAMEAEANWFRIMEKIDAEPTARFA